MCGWSSRKDDKTCGIDCSPHQSRRGATVQTPQSKGSDNIHCSWALSARVQFLTTSDLHLDFYNLHGVGGNDLTETSCGTRKHSVLNCQLVLRDVCSLCPVLAGKVVDGELDGLFWRDSNQVGHNSAVETTGAFLSNDLFEAIDSMSLKIKSGQRTEMVVLNGPIMDKKNPSPEPTDSSRDQRD